MSLKKIIEEPRVAKFWGKEYTGNDVLADAYLGDGKKLYCVTMLDTRPWSYYVRVDSKFVPDSDDNGIDEVIDLLLEEFGDSVECEECRDETGCEIEKYWYEDCESCDFPTVNLGSGYTYGLIRWRDIDCPVTHKSEREYIKAYNIKKAYLRYKKVKHTLDPNSKDYHSKFWGIIGNLDNKDVGVSIGDVLRYEESLDEKTITNQHLEALKSLLNKVHYEDNAITMAKIPGEDIELRLKESRGEVGLFGDEFING